MPCATISTHCLIGGLNVSRRNKSRPAGGTEKPMTATLDAFSNPLFSLGYGSQSPLEATEYPLTRMTDNYALLNSLYRSNWVVQNVVGLMVDDMLREWYDLKSTTPEQGKATPTAETHAPRHRSRPTAKRSRGVPSGCGITASGKNTARLWGTRCQRPSRPSSGTSWQMMKNIING